MKKINSFLNFKNFLLDKDSYVDYTYLWDLFSLPNENLFVGGINIILLELMNNDSTNNIELICPSNQYSSKMFDTSKRSIFIVKNGNYFEPLFSYKNKEKSIQVSQTFHSSDKNIPPQLTLILDNILNNIINIKCKPVTNLSIKNNFIPAIFSKELINSIEKENFKILQQVVNFQGKVIGFIIKNDDLKLKGMIPVFPCQLYKEYSIVYMDEVSWSDYNTTLKIIEIFFKNDKNKIYQIIEEKVIVGFLAPTNQFIQIDPPVPESEVKNDIAKLEENNYLIADIKTQLSKEGDKERIDFIKRITLETNFYNAFRNTIKLELNKYENLDIREELEIISNDNFSQYQIKLDNVTNLLEKLVKGKVIFVEKEDGFNIQEINDIYTCIVLPIDKCNENKPVCKFDNGVCNLIIPKNNLVTNSNNESYYYIKTADEVLRFDQVKSFMFNPEAFISIGKKNYNLKNSEILILQSLITQSYFENKIPLEMNNYVKFNTYDNAYPQNAPSLDNVIDLNLLEGSKKIDQVKISKPEVVEVKKFLEGRKVEEFERKCKIKKTKIISKKWKTCFPDNYSELNYESSLACSYKLLKDILFKTINVNVTMNELKSILINNYKLLIEEKSNIPNISSQIKKILSTEGKNGDELEESILMEDYWISNLDLWILLLHYKINSVFISPFSYKENNNKQGDMPIYYDKDKKYLIVIILQSQNIITIPNYKIIINKNNEYKLPIEDIDLSCFKNLNEITDKSNLIKYIEKFIPKKKIIFDIDMGSNKSIKKKPKQFLIVDED